MSFLLKSDRTGLINDSKTSASEETVHRKRNRDVIPFPPAGGALIKPGRGGGITSGLSVPDSTGSDQKGSFSEPEKNLVLFLTFPFRPADGGR